MKTILITGCSSGFGLKTANYFLERDWKVIATMRTLTEDVLDRSDNLRILQLDVTNAESIKQAVASAGPIDVLVNNAGIGLLNALESTPMEVARDVFETNTLGTIAMTQAVLPQFRQRKEGVIVNVTSSVTLMPMDLLSVYTASKAAVNEFSESLALELKQFNIRVNLVIPGQSGETRFAENAMSRKIKIHDAYSDLMERFFAKVKQSTEPMTRAEDVAEAIWHAVNDPSVPMRLPAGPDAVKLAN